MRLVSPGMDSDTAGHRQRLALMTVISFTISDYFYFFCFLLKFKLLRRIIIDAVIRSMGE